MKTSEPDLVLRTTLITWPDPGPTHAGRQREAVPGPIQKWPTIPMIPATSPELPARQALAAVERPLATTGTSW